MITLSEGHSSSIGLMAALASIDVWNWAAISRSVPLGQQMVLRLSIAQRKMLVLVNRNKIKIDRQQHNSTSNFESANSLITKFIRYDGSSIVSLCIVA